MKAIEKRFLLPFVLVTSMFMLWGLANNMTDTLLAAFRKIMQMSDTQTSFIQMAFYGAYFCIALPAALFIRKYSYKSGVVMGLVLYAAGAILFLPAAWTESYAFYLIAIYIMASGCSVLETASNPYIMSMGSPETATRRLNIAQSFNPLGSIMGILISKYFILQDISLYSVSGTYTALGIVLLAIMVIMLFSNMPEGKSSGPTTINYKLSTINSIRRLYHNRLYRWGVVAQFFYVGAQIGVWSFTIRIIMQEFNILEAQASNIYLITIIGFCLSRFIYTWLMKWIRPSKLLMIGGILSALMSATVVFTAGTGWIMMTALILISVFMSLMFPTIYGIALGDINNGSHPEDSKIGASGLIMAILGGALLTPLQGFISDSTNIYYSYIVPTISFVVVTCYAMNSLSHPSPKGEG